jgi:hypothetical protein
MGDVADVYDELPAGNTEPVPSLPAIPPPLPRSALFDLSDTSAPAPAVTGVAVAVVTEDAEPIYVNEKRDTEANPPLVPSATPTTIDETPTDAVTATTRMEAFELPAEPVTTDAVAVERDIETVGEPSVRESRPEIPQRAPRSRRVVVAAMSFASVCLGVTVGTIVWANGAAAQPQASPAANVVDEPARTAALAVPTTTAIVAAPESAVESTNEPSVELPVAAPLPASCALDITSSIADSSVFIDKRHRGVAPMTASVACGQPVTIEVRHARYASFEQTITPTAEHQTVQATLERERTTVRLVSEPPALVTIDGVPIGKTPMTTTVPRYEQTTFRFAARGYAADWRRVLPKTRKSTVMLKLEPR